LALHRSTPWSVAKRKAIDLLAAVHLHDPERRAQEYPHQFSGGMQQRAMIAMGLSLEPQLVIADEPTTALDVTVQAQVLKLVREIRNEHRTSILFITHDLGVVADLCDRVYVMYAGAVVEEGPVDRLFEHPSHPYTRGLLRATPVLHGPKNALASIPGQVPLATQRPRGCRFVDRCAFAIGSCHTPPPWVEVEACHRALCIRAGEAEVAA
jgi:peptide/nickel transport system ATP-binding protein